MAAWVQETDGGGIMAVLPKPAKKAKERSHMYSCTQIPLRSRGHTALLAKPQEDPPPVNYHVEEKLRLHVRSKSLSSGAVQRLGLGVESLALCRLSANSLEALDAKFLASSPP